MATAGEPAVETFFTRTLRQSGDTLERNRSEGRGSGRAERAASAILALASIGGFTVAALKLDTFWALVGIWSLAVALSTSSHAGPIRRPISLWTELLLAAYFISTILVSAAGLDPFGIGPPLAWLPSASVLALLAWLSVQSLLAHSSIRMNSSFAGLTAFVIVEAAIALQAPVSYYSDLLFGTDFLPSNQAYMTFVVLASIIGAAVAFCLTVMGKRELATRARTTDPEAT